VRRFPSRQDAESENPLEDLSNELLLPRGKAAFFGYFLCGGKESNPAAQQSEALQKHGPRAEKAANQARGRIAT
jgi:hypothetical protein